MSGKGASSDRSRKNPKTGNKKDGGKPGGGSGSGSKDLPAKVKKARGHRSKGAGTVQVSRGEITVSGIQMKEWQRTPKQLLNEYTQSQKRPRPIYHILRRAGGTAHKHWSRVVLRDKKGIKERDLLYEPQQHSDSKVLSEHMAALLALLELEGTRQYDRKLPEPFRTLWLTMTGRPLTTATGQEGRKGKKDKKGDKAGGEEHSCDLCDKVFKKDFALANHRKKEHKAELAAIKREEKARGGDNSEEMNRRPWAPTHVHAMLEARVAARVAARRVAVGTAAAASAASAAGAAGTVDTDSGGGGDNDGDVAVSAVSAVVREYPNLASVLRAALLLPHSDGRYVEEHERLYDMYYSSVL